jgi:hypothetical protein
MFEKATLFSMCFRAGRDELFVTGNILRTGSKLFPAGVSRMTVSDTI